MKWLPVTPRVCPRFQAGQQSTRLRQAQYLGDKSQKKSGIDAEGRLCTREMRPQMSLSQLKEKLAACSSWHEARRVLAMLRRSHILSNEELVRLGTSAYTLHLLLSEDFRVR